MYRQVAREQDALHSISRSVGHWAMRLRERDGFAQVEFVEATIDDLPFEEGVFDLVISNGVINLSPIKHRVFAETARVLRPGGRLALADIVSGKPLKERTRRNVELWAACIAGALPLSSYMEMIEAAGFEEQSDEQLQKPKDNWFFVAEHLTKDVWTGWAKTRKDVVDKVTEYYGAELSTFERKEREMPRSPRVSDDEFRNGKRA